jgi:hypothetical protein
VLSKLLEAKNGGCSIISPIRKGGGFRLIAFGHLRRDRAIQHLEPTAHASLMNTKMNTKFRPYPVK